MVSSRAFQRARGAVLVPVAVYAVHQARYLAAYGGHAEEHLHEEGHSYLDALALPLTLLIAVAVGLVAAEALAARRSGAGERRARGFVASWATAAAVLINFYIGQELLEGVLAHGHPEGLSGVFGHGGWLALPVALLIGALLSLLLMAGRAVVAWAARRGEPPARPAARIVPKLAPRFAARRTAPMASSAAGRAPPSALVAQIS